MRKRYIVLKKDGVEIEFIVRISFSIDSSGKRTNHVLIEKARQDIPDTIFLDENEIIEIIKSKLEI